MMLGSWTKNQLAPVFSLACFEVVWRTVVELAGAADLVLLPVGGVLLSNEVLDAGAVGRLLGLGLLGAATFQTLPEVFPERYLDWGNDVVARVVVAVGVVAVASLFNGLVGRLPILDGGAFSPGTTVLTLLGVSAVAGLLTTDHRARLVPQIQPFPSYIRYRQLPDIDTMERPAVGVIVSRVLLILAFGGLALAVVVRLYPLPELFIIAVTVYEGLSGPATVRTDIAEGFLAGLRAIWAGPQGILGVSYGIAALLAVVWLDVGYLTGLPSRAAVVGDPVTLLFFAVTLGVGTVHVMTGVVRLLERLPAAVGDDSAPAVDKPVIPGLLLPAAALFAWFEYVRPDTNTLSYSLTATVPELGVALVLAVVAVVPLFHPSKGPRLPVSDYLRIALAPSLGFGVWGMALLGNNQVVDLVVGLYALVMVSLSPFLGLEAFRLDRYGGYGDWFVGVLSGTALSRVGHPGEQVFDLLAEVCLAAIVFIVAAVLSLVFRDAINVVSLAISTVMIPAIAAVVFRLLLLPFYAPEVVVDRLGSW